MMGARGGSTWTVTATPRGTLHISNLEVAFLRLNPFFSEAHESTPDDHTDFSIRHLLGYEDPCFRLLVEVAAPQARGNSRSGTCHQISVTYQTLACPPSCLLHCGKEGECVRHLHIDTPG